MIAVSVLRELASKINEFVDKYSIVHWQRLYGIGYLDIEHFYSFSIGDGVMTLWFRGDSVPTGETQYSIGFKEFVCFCEDSDAFLAKEAKGLSGQGKALYEKLKKKYGAQ